ncbi:MAG: helix-turn-helix transcriptional regulator [Armatimonadota bacterium]|nr:helix-turn-helix transcriptional regulator [Armatimonadota bacterium]
MSIPTRNIGQLVRERRRELGLSIDALCYKAGISPRVVLLLERYGIEPRTQRVKEKLAAVLGIPVSELFPEAEEVVTP